MTVELLPGAQCSPEVMLHLQLQDMAKVKGAILLTLNEHGAVEVLTSCVTLSNLAYASLMLQIYAAECAKGTPPDNAQYFPPEGQ